MPSFRQWRGTLALLSFWERVTALGAFLLVLSGTLLFGWQWYIQATVQVAAQGGAYKEGIVGYPQYINPVLSPVNDADSALASLIFSGLMRVTPEGELVPDLAASYEIGDAGKIYDFTLRENLSWHDGEPLTPQDIVFTVQLIQDKEYRSPLLQNWIGVKAEALDGRRVRFTLREPYAPFLVNITVGIIPKHVWEKVTSQQFALEETNVKPVGSGPWMARKFEKNRRGFITSYTLKPYPDYHGSAPFLEKLEFRFFEDAPQATAALNSRVIDGIGGLNQEDIASFSNPNLFTVHRAPQTRYFAVFFNQTQSKTLADETARLALSHAVDKKKLLGAVGGGEGITIDAPILPGLLGYTNDTKIYDYAPEHARNILEAAGWTDTNADGIREHRDKGALHLTLTTVDAPELDAIAQALKDAWKEIGADVAVETFAGPELRQRVIRERTYEMLLFGVSLNLDPDPFSFWHSSQKFDPGRNLALYDNTTVDKLLEDARRNLDAPGREQQYMDFQKLLVDDVPALFLYSPSFLYPISNNVRGVQMPEILADPAMRFSNLEEWYVKTKRMWK